MKNKSSFFIVSIFIWLLFFTSIVFIKKHSKISKKSIDKIAAVKDLPDFQGIKDIKEKQHYFFKHVTPLAEKANKRVLCDREKLLFLLNKESLSKNQKIWINHLAILYAVKPWSLHSEKSKNNLLSRVDIVPIPLLLAQAAKESAWGTSRFAKEGNNLFGQWCFTKGCGIVPKQRASGNHHEVQKFSSIQASISSYIHNLNTNINYNSFRTLRAQLRTDKKPIDSLKSSFLLAGGLEKYSERRKFYVAEIRSMMMARKDLR